MVTNRNRQKNRYDTEDEKTAPTDDRQQEVRQQRRNDGAYLAADRDVGIGLPAFVARKRFHEHRHAHTEFTAAADTGEEAASRYPPNVGRKAD